MQTYLQKFEFIDTMKIVRPENFTYEGLDALFEYLESYEESTGDNIEFDPIALCCEYSEFANPLEAAQNYGYEECVDLEPHGSVDLIEVAELENKQAMEWLEERTQVIEVEGGRVIIQDF